MRWTIAFLFVSLISLVTYYFFPEQNLPQNTKIDKLVVVKHDHIMEAYSEGRLVKTYHVAIGKHATGDKEQKGDKRTPEGHYSIISKNPNSGYHKNLGISYPNAADRAAALAKGVDPGGDVKIHGLRNDSGFIGKFHRWRDWTAGCIAVTNEEMDELYEATSIGTVIWINP